MPVLLAKLIINITNLLKAASRFWGSANAMERSIADILFAKQFKISFNSELSVSNFAPISGKSELSLSILRPAISSLATLISSSIFAFSLPVRIALLLAA